MSALERLACALGRRDEIPNQELARELAASADQAAIAEIAAGLFHADKAIQADCIKVLYEIGYLQPHLIAAYAGDFVRLLKSRNNRLVWGGMLALSTVGALAGETLFPQLKLIQKTMDSGSVITRDAGVLALAGIASTAPDRRAQIMPYLLQHLRTCRPKDVPQHSEKCLVAVDANWAAEFRSVLAARLEDLQGAQLKRVQKVLRQLDQIE